MKLWILTYAPAYSTSDILGVFDTEELAKKAEAIMHTKKWSHPSDVFVEEYELNKFEGKEIDINA